MDDPHLRGTQVPERLRLLAHSRSTAFAVLLVTLTLTVLVAWTASVVVLAVHQPSRGDRGTVVLWLAAAQLPVLVMLVVVARVLARRSTRYMEHLFRLEDRVIRAVAHELRNPLTRLMAVADEGLTDARDPVATLRDVVDEGEALDEFIGDLAESIRVMVGDISLRPTPMRLDHAVAGVPGVVRPGEAEIRVEAEPVTVRGNPRLLRLAVINLVRNAAQHAYAGGPGVVIVRADRSGISVLDDGPGMHPAQVTEIVTNPTIAISRGLAGLGLPFVTWVAEAHGGHLVLSNRPEGGLEARVELPVAPAGPDAS